MPQPSVPVEPEMFGPVTIDPRAFIRSFHLHRSWSAVVFSTSLFSLPTTATAQAPVFEVATGS